jgi:hypothetical protein
MKIILIDTENISNKEYEYIANLKNYKLIFFETRNTMSTQISLSLAIKLSEARVKFNFMHVDVKGKNALDFKICTQAGKINKWYNDVYILSKDKGYDNLKEFNIYRIESITNLKSHSYSKTKVFMNNIKSFLKRKTEKSVKVEETIQSKVKFVISDICNKYENDTKFINDIIIGINKKDKLFIHNIVQKKFKSSDMITQKQLYKALLSISI